MKAILSLLLTALLLLVQRADAQQFSPTTGVPCNSCHPTNYTMAGQPSISDVNRPSGYSDVSWNNPPSNVLPPPPSTYSQNLPVDGGKNSFITLEVSEDLPPPSDRLFLEVDGFSPNKTYNFRYSVLFPSFYGDLNGVTTGFAESAKMEIFYLVGQQVFNLASQTVTFDGNNKNVWIQKEISFIPPVSKLKFVLSGKKTGTSIGYVNFSIDKYPFDCQLDYSQPQLFRSTINTLFPKDKLDLSTVLVTSATPATTELVWKMGPNSTDATLTTQEAASVPISNEDPANVKPYYAFYYAKDFNCYSAQISQAQLKFMHVPTQVPLKASYVSVSCTEPTTDLTTFLDNPAAPVIWYTTNNHQGSQLFNPQAAPPGDYYAFYYNASKGGFSLTSNLVSTAHVKVENPIMPGTPDLGPTMSINSLIFPQNGNKDFVVRIQNILASNSGCSVFFKVTKLPGFTITYNMQAGQSNVDGGIFNNNDMWFFSEDDNFITVTSKYGISASGYSDIGFKMTRNANTPANTAQNVTVVIPQQGGGGELNTANNIAITTVNTAN